jgi:hypothetical protein
MSFGGLDTDKDELFDKLQGPKVHLLYNILTLSHDIHMMFDKLELWLEPTVTSSFTPTQSGF